MMGSFMGHQEDSSLPPEMAPQGGSEQERDVTGIHRVPLAVCEEQPVGVAWGPGETRQKVAWKGLDQGGGW